MLTYADVWNETQHLKIMEALGGDQSWIDRFLGTHFTCFTGTKVQILTQKALLESNAAIFHFLIRNVC